MLLQINFNSLFPLTKQADTCIHTNVWPIRVNYDQRWKVFFCFFFLFWHFKLFMRSKRQRGIEEK